MAIKNKPIFKWIKAIGIVLFASLIYAVYFTDLGKPPIKIKQPITFYDQTAVPTLFVESSQAPTVKLDWAYANQKLLKFVISIHGMGINKNPSDWICDPYIRIIGPIQPRLSGGGITPIYDTSGESVQATYEYEINADNYESLTVDLDLTIGPCADYLNFQESNVTPTFIPLIANYHLSFQVPIQISAPSTLAQSTAVDGWNGIPIYPGAYQLNEEETFYIYTVQDTPENIEAFYNDKMASEGWTKFDKSNVTIDNRQEVSLSFSKANQIVTISILKPVGAELTKVSVGLIQ